MRRPGVTAAPGACPASGSGQRLARVGWGVPGTAGGRSGSSVWAVSPLGADHYRSSWLLVLGAAEKDVFRASLFLQAPALLCSSGRPHLLGPRLPSECFLQVTSSVCAHGGGHQTDSRPVLSVLCSIVTARGDPDPAPRSVVPQPGLPSVALPSARSAVKPLAFQTVRGPCRGGCCLP